MADEDIISPDPAPATPTRDYAEVWAHAALGLIRGLTEDTGWERVTEPVPASCEPLEMVAHVELSGDLVGIQQFRFHRAAARAWAQIMLPPAPEARQRQVPIDDAERDALTEMVRRLLAAVTPELRACGWGDVKIALRHLGPLRRTVENSEKSQVLKLRHPNGAEVELDMAFDRTLREHIHHRLHPDEPSPAKPGEARDAGPGAAKMDLLLDVELDVTLRFGGRQMLLHDVCDLAPGSVLELDRHIDDPVELMVGNKIIAWGEVVVVDGNYGVRVNRLVHRRERMAAMEAAR